MVIPALANIFLKCEQFVQNPDTTLLQNLVNFYMTSNPSEKSILVQCDFVWHISEYFFISWLNFLKVTVVSENCFSLAHLQLSGSVRIYQTQARGNSEYDLAGEASQQTKQDCSHLCIYLYARLSGHSCKL